MKNDKIKIRDEKKELLKKILLYLVPFLLLVIILLAFYPGIYTYDGDFQWEQVTSGYMNNGHPFLSTYFQYLLSHIWKNNTVLLVFQILLLTFIWGYITNEFYKEYRNNYKRILIYSSLFILCPIICLYAITAWKDVLYSYYLFAIVYFLYKGSKNNFKYSNFEYVLIGLLLFNVFNYRVNGMIVAVLLLMFFYFILYKNRKSIKILNTLLIVLTFIIANVILLFPKNYHINRYNEHYTPADTGNEYSIPVLDNYRVWIMGAFIKNDYVEEEDLKFLNNCIEIEEWKEVYRPYLINDTSLASTRNEKFISENLEKFRTIFNKYLIKHPFTVFDHYIKAANLLIGIIPKGYVYQYDFVKWYPNYSFDVEKTSKIKWFNKLYEKFVGLTMRGPIRIWFYRPSIMMYIIILLTLLLVRATKNKMYWIVSVPMLSNIMSLLPISIAQDLRYVYINYLTFGFLLLIIVNNYETIKKYILLKIKRH